MNVEVTGAASDRAIFDDAVTKVLAGDAPFPGVTNASGQLAGKMLAERQYYNVKRIVGRMSFELGTDKEISMPNGGMVRVYWSLIRWHTDEQGIPDADLLTLYDGNDQDEKPIILAQDVWSTAYPVGTTLNEGFHQLAADPPLYSMVDKTMRRPFRNEQALFLLTTGFVHCYTNSAGIPMTTELTLRSHINLRTLGTFGR